MEIPRFQLSWAENTLDVVGSIVIGRGIKCDVVLDDLCVSRRHAVVEPQEGHLLVEDLGSRNGVVVNGARVTTKCRLFGGDLLLLGAVEFHVLSLNDCGLEGNTERGADLSLHPTQRFDALGTVGQLAEKALALGHVEEAERLLSPLLMQLLQEVRTGRKPNANCLERASELVVELLAVTHHGGWLDWLVLVFSAIGKPWSAVVVERLYAVGRVLAGYDHQMLHAYCEQLRATRMQLGPAERFQVGRIEGLTQLLSAS